MRLPLFQLFFLLLLAFPVLFSPAAPITMEQALAELTNIRVKPLVPIMLGLAFVLAALLYALGQGLGAEQRARLTVWATQIAYTTIIASILFVVFVGFTDPVFIQNSLPQDPVYSRAVVYIALSLSFSLALIMLFYILAAIFQHPPLDALKREEVAAFIMTIFIIIGWGFIHASLSSVTRALLCAATNCPANLPLTGAYGNHIGLATASLEILYTRLLETYVHLYLFEVLIGFLSTISFPIGSLIPGVNIISITFMPFDGLNLLVSAHTVVVEAIGYLIMLVMAKQQLLLFVRDGVPTILLPLGLALRAFPWFRTTGSSLISLCVVAYFVFPLSVLLTNYLMFDIFQPANFGYASPGLGAMGAVTPAELKTKIEKSNDDAQGMLAVFQRGSTVAGQVEASCGTGPLKLVCDAAHALSGTGHVIAETIKTAWEIMGFMWGFGSDFFRSMFHDLLPSGATGGLYNFIAWEVAGVSQFIVLVIFSSVIEIIITITMYRGISALIGGEMEIAGLTKLV